MYEFCERIELKDLLDIFTIVTVALCCPIAMLVPPFSDLMCENKNREEGQK